VNAPDRWHQLERLYHEALACDEHSRAAFVRTACEGDESLRRELESLLAYSNAAPEFMATPALDVAAVVIPAAPSASLIGRRLGSYEIASLLGAGGMGEVYRARDLTLGRDVAIKVLPDAFTVDPERRARFDREARLLASLNHPHIGAIYGVEHRDGIHALVLELVEGTTLADRLRAGPLPIREAVGIAGQIADALDAAHEKGIVHRDLKPANIALSAEGIVKVLDFGLAKARDSGGVTGPAPTPTISTMINTTGSGVVLGTAAYMSPEQARGRVVDRRTDLWAFGCVLYEMLTGRRTFAGDTTSDTIAAILDREPDWSTLPAATPAAIRRLLHRCLEKDPKRRLRDAGDAKLELGEPAGADSAGDRDPTETRSRRSPWMAAAAAALVAVAAIAVALSGLLRSRAAPLDVTRFSITPPPNVELVDVMAMSPDENVLVYAGNNPSSGRLLYKRSLDGLETVPIRGTESGAQPFFSPDGRSVGFFDDRNVKRIPVDGGIAVDVAVGFDAGGGGAWLRDDTIVFESANRGLMRVPAAGGRAAQLTTIDTAGGEVRHLFPAAVPGERAVLFTVYSGARDGSRVEAVSLQTGERRRLIAGNAARVFPGGRIVFERGGSLWVALFDADRLQLTGPATAVLEGVTVGGGQRGGWNPQLAVGPRGSVAYGTEADPFPPRMLFWVDRAGRETQVDAPPRAWWHPNISPDGRRLGFHIMDSGNMDAWIYQLDHGPLVRVTYDPRQDGYPLWTPDGSRIVFWSRQGGGAANLYIRPADLSGGDERLTTSVNAQRPYAWADHGKLLVYEEASPDTGIDIGVVRIDGEHAPRLIIRGPFHEARPTMSPDGRWIAYDSNLTGRFEIYVQPFPGLQSRWQVSTEGGMSPIWSPSGKEIFYRRGHAVMTVPVESSAAGFAFGNAKTLFVGSYVEEDPQAPGLSYTLAPDGQRFLMMRETDRRPSRIVVIRNWASELDRRAAAR
jgi:serine/threonine-protein kinase